jgi:phosphoglycolate phosphatase-like HAD superfamily hydrolase
MKRGVVAEAVVEANAKKNIMSKTHIIFDFDGTIADTIPVMRTIAQHIADEGTFDLQLTEENWAWVRDHSITELPAKFGVPLLRIPGLILQGREMMKKQILSVPVCRGVEALIHTLKEKGYVCGILSSSKREMIQEFLLQHNLVEEFEFVHSELNLFGKDKALLSLIKQYHLSRDETIYVGDELRDYEACKKIGLDCISVTWGLNSRTALTRAGNEMVIDSPAELISLLQ